MRVLLLIALGSLFWISAAMAQVPDNERQVQSALATLQTLRSQLELYRLQHNDKYPDFERSGWEQLLGGTDEQGRPGSKFGPYLAAAPVNALRNASKVEVIAKHMNRTDDAEVGWLFREERLYAVDKEGEIIALDTLRQWIEAKVTPEENPVVRGRTVMDLGASVKNAAQAAPEQKRDPFRRAVEAIAAKSILRHEAEGGAQSKEFAQEMVDTLSGKSVDEIIILGQPLQGDAQVQEELPKLRSGNGRKPTEALLQTLRAQLELYKLQHDDQLPDFEAYGWAQMLKKTEKNGRVAAKGEFGPYLAAAPENLLRSASAVARGNLSATVDDAKVGWLLAPDGRLYALDAKGQVLGQ